MTVYLPKILIVDDRPENLVAMKKVLARTQARLYTASSGNEALSLIISNDFALILLDVQMPEMDGFETAEIMRSSDYAATTPIIFITAISKEQQHVFRGYDSGAVDYIFKPVEPKILQSKVGIFLELDGQRRELEAAREELLQKNLILKELSTLDELTGLFNRRQLNATLQQEFSRCKRYNTDLSCMMLDLDHFKNINDTYGHNFGDVVISTFAQRLSGKIRSTDFAFRFGGEEFTVLLPHTDIHGAEKIAQKICKSNEKVAFTSEYHTAFVTTSIGLASFHQHHPSEQENLLGMADKALYAAKENGRNRVEIYR